MGFNWATAIVCLGWEERTDFIYSPAKELIVLNCLFIAIEMPSGKINSVYSTLA